jgi:hypothetical protein
MNYSPISKTKSHWDKELQTLLTEISFHKWEEELESYRQEMIQEKVQHEINSKNKIHAVSFHKDALYFASLGLLIALSLNPETLSLISTISQLILLLLFFVTTAAFTGIVGGLILIGITGIIPAACSIAISSIPGAHTVIAVIVCTLASFFMGSFFLELYHRQKLKLQNSDLYDELRKHYLDYILEPQELLNFYNQRIASYFFSKKSWLQSRMNEFQETKDECREILKLHRTSPESFDQAEIINMQEKLYRLNNLHQETAQVLNIIQQVESGFEAKMNHLKTLANHQKQLEERKSKLEQVQKKLENFLGAEQKESWDSEKDTVKHEIKGIILAMQEQFSHTREFVKAQIQLESAKF